jgi:hypothetical protein
MHTASDSRVFAFRRHQTQDEPCRGAPDGHTASQDQDIRARACVTRRKSRVFSVSLSLSSLWTLRAPPQQRAQAAQRTSGVAIDKSSRGGGRGTVV